MYAIDVNLLELVASGPRASIGLNDPPSARELQRARYWLRFFKLSGLARRRRGNYRTDNCAGH